MKTAKSYVESFRRFWWDFLIGDTPELFIGVLVIVGSSLLLRHQRDAAISVVPSLTVLLLGASVYRGRRRT
jgi:hypothetical protein